MNQLTKAIAALVAVYLTLRYVFKINIYAKVKTTLAMTDLMYIEKVPLEERAAFTAAVRELSDWLGLDTPNALMAVMKKESGISPSIVNPNGGATGLIQFMPSTALGLGTTTAKLKRMSRLEQLVYVKKYFAPFRGKLKNYAGLYFATFFPAAIPHISNDNWVFEAKNVSRSAVYKGNYPIDYDGDKTIEMWEFKKYLKKGFTPEQLAELF